MIPHLVQMSARKERDKGKTKHIIMYTWSEVKKLIIIQEGMSLKVNKGIPKKPDPMRYIIKM